MKLHKLLLAALLFGSAQGLTMTTQVPAAHAKAGFKQVTTIPSMLNLQQGDRVQLKGLANGKMSFVKLSGTMLELHQDMVLSSIGRTAIEKAVGKKLSGKGNHVAFRFTVKKEKNGFTYELFDRGSKQQLLSGPVKVFAGPKSATSQQVDFHAPLVRMKVTFQKASAKASKGIARFSLGPIPVPGSLSFHEISK